VHVRRLARISALQALYELDTTSHPADQVIAYRLAATRCNDPALRTGMAGFADRHH
jgi:transcription termination factor NusB